MNPFKALGKSSTRDFDEEVDIEFDISTPMMPEPSLPENIQVLSVWGSPQSGKSIISAKLARLIAGNKKNVVLVLADTQAPTITYICPQTDLETQQSLGNILSCASITEQLVKQNAILHRKNEYITMFGMLKGENAFSFPPFTQGQVQDFISILRGLADYIIIDCTSNITSDILSAVAIMESDAVLKLATSDLKSISYFNSQMPILIGNNNNKVKQFKAVSDIKALQATENVEQIMDGAQFRIPHCEEVEQQLLNGNLFAGLSRRDSKPFRKAIADIANEVFGL